MFACFAWPYLLLTWQRVGGSLFVFTLLNSDAISATVNTFSLSVSDRRESMNMVTPAMQLASKIPDTQVQLWATALLKGTFDSGVVVLGASAFDV